MKFKRYLLEKTFNVGQDVDFLYKKGFKQYFDIIRKYGLEEARPRLLKLTAMKMIADGRSALFIPVIGTEELKSKDSKTAHMINPANIAIGAFVDGNFYRPSSANVAISKKLDPESFKIFATMMGGEKGIERSRIQVSLNYEAWKLYLRNQFDFVASDVAKKAILREYRPDSIKSSIAHELSHWISDSRYGSHIEKLLTTVREMGKDDLLKLGKEDVNMTYFEVDAQIHSLKQLKRQYNKQWDSFKMKDIFDLLPSWNATAQRLVKSYGEEVFKIWQKSLVKRMARENLLGKNMRSFATKKDIMIW